MYIINRLINKLEGVENEKNTLCPEFFLSCLRHPPLALGTGMQIPDTDAVAAAMQAQPPYLASERWGHVGDDASHHDVLHSLAVGATHRGDLLAKKTAAFIYVGFIAAVLTSVFFLPRHVFK